MGESSGSTKGNAIQQTQFDKKIQFALIRESQGLEGKF
jgi:hypothetical protein